MTPTLAQLQVAFKTNDYVWHPKLNLIGIRNVVDVPDAFNDSLVCAWLQPACPQATILEQQRWLNSWFITGPTGLPLVEDGVSGKATQFALTYASRLAGTWRIKSWTITTDPGVYYLQHPIDPAIGCAVVKPGQYKNVWQLGFHQGKASHPALVQRGGEITVYLDNDRDKLSEASSKTKTGFFGINCHHASETMTSQIIGKWSAGCQVFPKLAHHQELLAICEHYKAELKNFYTYTLLLSSMV